MPCRALILSLAVTLPLGAAFAQQPPARPAQPPAAGAPAGQPPACIQQFIVLRDEAQKRATAIRTASERKVGPQEACPLFKNFVEAEAKVIKYAEDQGVWCGIPAEALAQMKKAYVHSSTLRTKVCQAAAQPGGGRPAGPSLSDALGAPSAAPSEVKPGRGTFDTLTGSPLGGAR